MAGAVRVHGLKDLDRTCRRFPKDLRKEMRKELKEAGKIVAEESSERFQRIDPASAATMKERVRGGLKVVVEQRRRRTTGLRPDFGGIQMEIAFIPGLTDKEDEVIRRVDNMLGRLGGQHF